MIFALCSSLRDATSADLKSPSYMAKYVGGSWVPKWIQALEDRGHQVMTGKEALQAPPGFPIHVIQEDQTPEGVELLNRGAHGQVLYCLESPMYVPHFYEEMADRAKHFRHVWSFTQGERIPFPSFDSVPESFEPWEGRKPIVMVMSNKHYHRLPHPEGKVIAYMDAIKNQLHDERYAALAMKTAGFMDLFGKGWPDGYAQEIENKHEVISKYKFGVCFENVAMPGYVTEKIIDHFVAGVIPIYRGAPDIADFIPRNLFVDYGNFGTWPKVIEHLQKITPEAAEAQIQAARTWLKSPEGQRYSYQGFANRITEMCLQC